MHGPHIARGFDDSDPHDPSHVDSPAATPALATHAAAHPCVRGACGPGSVSC